MPTVAGTGGRALKEAQADGQNLNAHAYHGREAGVQQQEGPPGHVPGFPPRVYAEMSTAEAGCYKPQQMDLPPPKRIYDLIEAATQFGISFFGPYRRFPSAKSEYFSMLTFELTLRSSISFPA